MQKPDQKARTVKEDKMDMGLFEKFKKKIESVNEKSINDKSVEAQADDQFELILSNLYGELANVIISAIPEDWEEFHYLGEVAKGKISWSSVFFVKNIGSDEYVKCFDLKSFGDQCSNDMDVVLFKIYDCFIQNHQKPWEQLCLSVKNTGDFKVNFNYDVMEKSEYGQVEREVIWAYETFGGKPQNSPFLISILEQYLKKKK